MATGAIFRGAMDEVVTSSETPEERTQLALGKKHLLILLNDSEVQDALRRAINRLAQKNDLKELRRYLRP